MNIDVENGLIEAKSEHDYYVKEASGVKPHTERIVNVLDASMLRALQTAIADEHEAVTIVITDVSTLGKKEPPASVRREVTDINFYGEECGHFKVSITWRHMSLGEELK